MLEKRKNVMREIKLSEVILNCGATGEKLDRSIKLLGFITGKEPIKTLSKKRIPAFEIRPRLPIGCKVTVRGKEAEELLKKLLSAIDNKLNEKQIGAGHLNFGIHEYIEIPSVQYQRDIGILGLNVSVNLIRKGGSFIERRRTRKGHVPSRHKISKEETKMFIQEKFNTKIPEKRK